MAGSLVGRQRAAMLCLLCCLTHAALPLLRRRRLQPRLMLPAAALKTLTRATPSPCGGTCHRTPIRCCPLLLTLPSFTFAAAGAENSYNLFTVRRNADAATDEERSRLEVGEAEVVSSSCCSHFSAGAR